MRSLVPKMSALARLWKLELRPLQQVVQKRPPGVDVRQRHVDALRKPPQERLVQVLARVAASQVSSAERGQMIARGQCARASLAVTVGAAVGAREARSNAKAGGCRPRLWSVRRRKDHNLLLARARSVHLHQKLRFQAAAAGRRATGEQRGPER